MKSDKKVFYVVSGDGYIVQQWSLTNEQRKDYINVGNLFTTQKEAQYHLARLISIAKITN